MCLYEYLTIILMIITIVLGIYIPKKILVNQIFSDLLKEYRSSIMGIALKRMRDFFEEDCQRKTDPEYIISKYDEICKLELNKYHETLDKSLHFQRRIVSQFYQQLSNLHLKCIGPKIGRRTLQKHFSTNDLDIIQILCIIDSHRNNELFSDPIPDIDIEIIKINKHNSLKKMYRLYRKSLKWKDTMIKNNNLLVSIIAFVSLLTSIRLFSKILGKFDFDNELSSNEQLQKASEDIKSRTKENIINQVIKIGIILRRKSLKSFTWLLSATLIACVVNLITNQFDIERFLITSSKALFPFISIFLFAFGTLGRLSWEGQTLDGNTIYEKLDNRILWITYFIGTIFGVSSIL